MLKSAHRKLGGKGGGGGGGGGTKKKKKKKYKNKTNPPPPPPQKKKVLLPQILKDILVEGYFSRMAGVKLKWRRNFKSLNPEISVTKTNE